MHPAGSKRRVRGVAAPASWGAGGRHCRCGAAFAAPAAFPGAMLSRAGTAGCTAEQPRR
jgi:hypothetical protein